MKQQIFEVEQERFLLGDSTNYCVYGIIPESYMVEAYLDSKKLKCVAENLVAKTAMERFNDSELGGNQRVKVVITLPKDFLESKKLKLYAVSGEKRISWFVIHTKALEKKKTGLQYYIDEERWNRKEAVYTISGWAVSESAVQIKVYDDKKKRVSAKIQTYKRQDVVEMFKEYPIEESCGFSIELENVKSKVLYFVMLDKNGKKSVYTTNLSNVGMLLGKTEKYRKKGMQYFKSHGAKAVVLKAATKLRNVRNRPIEYSEWLPRHLPTEKELSQQRQERFTYEPKISIVIPLYKTKIEFLDALIHSIQQQTYKNWELCLSDGSGKDSPLTEYLTKCQKDKRIKVISHTESLRIAENTNAAIQIATGEYIAFADHDDLLAPHALYEFVKKINEVPDTEMIYSDEDKIKGTRHFMPHFKPDFNLDLLCTVNYICHFLMVKRSLLEKAGWLDEKYDGAQDYDFILRCVENTDKICHVPKILYHWRSHEDSTAENPESKKYAFEAGARAIQAHFDRIGVAAEVYQGEYDGLYRTKYLRGIDPLISIIIPNKDHIADLERCINSIEKKSTYHNYEYIIVENNSEEEETFAYYEKLQEKNSKVKVVYWDGPFNYSDINNYGISFAKGEYLLLLNNDTEVINGDWLEELLGYCMRPDVGIVGARLYYEDDTIQHAGVVIGFSGIAGHCFVQQPRGTTGYCHRIICAQDYSAVTAACMMVKREAFEAAGGLSPDLAVAFNDIDFCLKVREKGYLVVYNPYVELYHYESKSRGLEDTPEKKARFAREIAIFEKHWPKVFEKPDPYYNPNLTLKSQDFSLRKI